MSGFVWLIHGWYKQHWWKTGVVSNDTNCTDQEIEAQVKRSIAILQIPTSDNVTATTDVGLVSFFNLVSPTCIYLYVYVFFFQTANDFRVQYEKKLGNNPSEPSAAVSYDAVWTLAHALNQYVFIHNLCVGLFNSAYM